MQWRLNVLTVIAKGILMVLFIAAGASVVRNVTAALTGAVGVCETAITHLR